MILTPAVLHDIYFQLLVTNAYLDIHDTQRWDRTLCITSRLCLNYADHKGDWLGQIKLSKLLENEYVSVRLSQVENCSFQIFSQYILRLSLLMLLHQKIHVVKFVLSMVQKELVRLCLVQVNCNEEFCGRMSWKCSYFVEVMLSASFTVL